MSESNVEVVRALFDGYAQRGVDGVIDVVHEDVVIEIPPDLSAEPDTYLGHEGVRRYFAGFEGMLEDDEVVAPRLLQPDRHAEAAEAPADDGDIGLGRRRHAGHGIRQPRARQAEASLGIRLER